MKKKIGVFIGEIAQEYQEIVAKGIAKKAEELGYDVIYICAYGNYTDDILYIEGEKACITLPDVSFFDGIIITEDVFDIDGMADELYEIIKAEAKCPVVYLRTTRPGCYGVVPENQLSMENMVRHFTDDHGFTDICYMSGKQCLQDSTERLNGYLSVMESKGIPVNDHMIFHGDYWRYKAVEALDWFMEGRDTYPQAIVCANDYMALSICEELQKRGIRVPEDVCISGFDYVDESKTNIPSLTSLEIDFEGIATKAVEIIDNILSGGFEEPVHRVPAKMRINKSCGCGKQHVFSNIIDLIKAEHRNTDDTKNIFLSVSEYQEAFEFNEYMSIARKYRRFMRADEVYFCMADKEEEGFDEVENDTKFTRLMHLKKSFVGESTVDYDIKFPRKKILPDELWRDDRCDKYCVFAVHFKNKLYGYIVAKMPEDGQWFDIYTQGYLMTLANAIENSEIHKKMEALEEIQALYQNDALTGILNRRGFDKKMQDRYALVASENKHLGLASIDMDNLKEINDTYGHSEGDKALILLANALKSVMKGGDFCARIGGDEFSAIIDITKPDRCTEFKKELQEAIEHININSMDLPYKIGASVGICQSNEHEASSLLSCVRIADSRMYSEKRERKAGRSL